MHRWLYFEISNIIGSNCVKEIDGDRLRAEADQSQTQSKSYEEQDVEAIEENTDILERQGIECRKKRLRDANNSTVKLRGEVEVINSSTKNINNHLPQNQMENYEIIMNASRSTQFANQQPEPTNLYFTEIQNIMMNNQISRPSQEMQKIQQPQNAEGVYLICYISKVYMDVS